MPVMRQRRSCIALSLSLLLSLVAVPLHDAYAAGEADMARSHFDAGKKLRDEGDCVHAIAEFDKSLAADKSIGAYYNLGFCHEQLGHKQDAHEAYKHARELASMKKDERLREISGALASLLESSAHIRLVLPAQLPDGIQITVDDQLVPDTYYATEMVVFTKNATSHSVVVTAPGWEDRHELVLNKAVKAIELRRSELKKDATKLGSPPATEAPHSWKTLHYVSLSLVGASLIAGGVGTIFVFDHLGRLDAIDRDLNANLAQCAPSTNSSCQDEAKKNRNSKVSTENTRGALLIVGSYSLAFALLVSGGILFITVPSSSDRTSSTAATRLSSAPKHAAIHFTPIADGKGTWGGALVGSF